MEEAQLTLEHTKAQLENEFAKTDGVADEAKRIDQLLAAKTTQDTAINKSVAAPAPAPAHATRHIAD